MLYKVENAKKFKETQRMKKRPIIILILLILISLPIFGGSVINKKKIIFCGVAKNIEKAIPATVLSFQKLGSYFADYRVIIYENNSIDNSSKLLDLWKKKNPKVTFISEILKEHDLYTQSHGQTRKLHKPELIARARNIVLDIAMQSQYEDFDYILMADLDFLEPWDIEGILSSFNFEEDWDAICANGIASNGEHWDWYAFRDVRYPFGPELYGPEWWSSLPEWRKNVCLHPDDPFLSVISAFGGLAIYKRSSIKNCFYSGSVTPDLESLMSTIINSKRIYQKNFLDNGRIKWLFDTHIGITDSIIVCEHVTFHASMIKKGKEKIFVNPRMIMKYWQCL